QPRPIEEFLPPVDDDRRGATLEELVQIELEFAWKRNATLDAEGLSGAPPLGPIVEDYLTRFPDLWDPPTLLRLLRQEYQVRQRHGDRPGVLDYCERFPNLLSTPLVATPLLCPLGEIDPPPASVPLRPGRKVGRYRLVEKQGRGGFGEVWRAHDPDLGRDVALKQLHPSLSSRSEYVARFAAEARTAARLEHPGVVPVHEFAFAEDGTPFYTMRLFGGQTLAEAIHRIHDPALTPGARSIGRVQLLGTFLDVLRAVEFAHDQGTIHRDLTPRNILLGDYGETIILDWGLARGPRSPSLDVRTQVDSLDDHPEPGLTDPGTVMGTPPYMAPEQSVGRNDRVDRRSDVYALGVILQEVLTGVLPERLALPLDVSPALVAICRKATARNQDARYPDAKAFREDLERCLADEPVSAYSEPWTARLVRWGRRRRRLVTTAGVGLAVGLVVSASMLVVLLEVNRRLNRATEAATIGKRQAESQRLKAEAALEQTRITLDRNLVLQAYGELANNNPTRARALLEACRPSGRDWEWNLASRLCPRQDALILDGHKGPVRRVKFSPDSRRIASVGGDGLLIVRDAGTGHECWRQKLGGPSRGLAYSPNGRTLVTASIRSRQAPIRFWNAASGVSLAEWGRDGGDVVDLAFSPDGQSLATGGVDGVVRLRDASSGKTRHVMSGHRGAVLGVAYSPDGTLLASCGADDNVILWSTETGKRLQTDPGQGKNVNALAFSPDGRILATAGDDRAVRLRSVASWTPSSSLERHSREVTGVAFGPDGRFLASASMDRTLRIWDLVDGRERIVPLGHQGHVLQVAISPDGSAVASAGSDWNVRVWRLDDLQQAHTFPGKTFALHPDGARLATADHEDDSPQNTIWRIDTGESVRVLEGLDSGLLRLAISPDGRILASGHTDGSIGLWDFATGRLLRRLERHATPVYSLAFRPGNGWIASGAIDGTIWISDLDSEESLKLPGHTSLVSSLAFSPDGSSLASSSKDLTAKVWSLTESRATLTLQGHSQPLTRLAYSHDGRRIATTSIDGEMIVWDASRGTRVHTTRVGVIDLNTVAFSPDDRRIATGSEELLCLWDAETGAKLCTFPGFECIIDLEFTRDGKTLALAGPHQGVRVLSTHPEP
ncbi:MAG: protein kinase, partial [Isosphaeraceae bacterium]